MSRRASLATLLAIGWSILLFATAATTAAAGSVATSGPPFPAPKAGQTVYDPDHLLKPATVATLQSAAGSLVTLAHVQPVVYVERAPDDESAVGAQANADALAGQWKIGRGMVVLIDVASSGCTGHVSVGRGSQITPTLVGDDLLHPIADTAEGFLLGCDIDTAAIVALSNLSVTLINATAPPSASPGSGPGTASGASPGASTRPTATPRTDGTPAGPPFPDPVAGQYVYDEAHVFTTATITKVQAEIQAIRDRTGAEIVVYTQVVGSETTDDAEAHARALIDQWGVGRKGFDDGLAILYDLDQTRVHGQVQLYAGPGYAAAFLSDGERQDIFENDMLPLLKEGNLDLALLAAMAKVDANATPEHAATLNRARVANAIIGLAGAPILLLLLIAWPLFHWFRHGRDPNFLDDPSILMPAPPPDLTAAAGALVYDGRSSRHTLTTALLDLAARDELAFRPEVHRLGKDRMGIEVRNPNEDDPRVALNRRMPISPAEIYARMELDSLAEPDKDGAQMVDSTALLKFGPKVSAFNDKLELYATHKGWFATAPSSAMARWYGQGFIEIVLGVVAIIAAVNLPSSGLLLLGGAAVVAGIVTVLLAQAMPARTLAGATIRAMLAAYRRTLEKTMFTARSMDQVVASQVLPWLQTPDEAVVWGVALGLRQDVEEVLGRAADDITHGHANPATTYLPVWYGARGWNGMAASGGAGGIAPGLFSGSAIPDFGGMMSAIGTVGNSPSSSGGYGGGGSGGGGGGAGGGF